MIENVSKMGFWRKLKENTEKERSWWKETNPVWSETAKLPLVTDKTRPLVLVPVNLFSDQSSPSWPVLYAGTCLLMCFGTLEQETPIEDPRLVLSSAGTWKVKVSQKDQHHFRLASFERPFSATSAVLKQRFTCGLTPSVMSTITKSLKLRAVQRRISGKQNVVLRVGEWRATNRTSVFTVQWETETISECRPGVWEEFCKEHYNDIAARQCFRCSLRSKEAWTDQLINRS